MADPRYISMPWIQLPRVALTGNHFGLSRQVGEFRWRRAAATVLADPRYISIPRIQLLRAASDNVGEESGWCDGTVVDGRTAAVARMGEVTVG